MSRTRHPRKPKMPARRAWLWLDGWMGRYKQAVDVIGETPCRYRIRALAHATRLAGRERTLNQGEVALVPKYAITFSDPHSDTWTTEGAR